MMSEPRPEWPCKRAEFTVYGDPVPKARPRVTARGTYTPQRVKDWQEMVATTYRQSLGPVFAGPVQVTMHFYRKDRRRVDIDNLAKAVMDGLNGIAWADDSQIHRLVADLRQDKEAPRVEILIEPWNVQFYSRRLEDDN